MNKLRCTALLLVSAAISLTAGAQPTSITHVAGRSLVSLNGNWQTIVDPYENGFYSYRYEPRGDGYFLNRKPVDPGDLVEYDFDTSPELSVPGDWNSQRAELLFYEGTVWYKRSVNYQPEPGHRVFVHFGAANYEARVYFNGVEVGHHVGGFTPFAFEVTDQLRGTPDERSGDFSNHLIVKVDNSRSREGVPTLNTDWWNYGGLTRGVQLVDVPLTFIRDYVVQLAKGNGDRIEGFVQLDGPEMVQDVVIAIPAAGIRHRVTTDPSGAGSFSFPADVKRWHPDDPYLHEVIIESETDRVSDEIGFRTIETDGSQILLNGEPVFLRGISIHEEAPIRGGRAFGVDDSRTLLTWAQELGCNFVRLAHYPHNESMVREADRLGIMVWSEIPVYWTILWDNPATLRLATQQLEEMVVRDRNRSSVVIWSVANETPRSSERLAFLTRLIDRTRELDPTRLLSAATELTYEGSHIMVDDPLAEDLDVIGANEYVGWYGGKISDIAGMRWQSAFDKPLIISEFGAGALYGYHGDSATRWTEEYQAELYRQQIEMVRTIPFLAGMSPWILADFRSPRRPLPRIQDFWNRKGLVSERGERKAAFDVLREFYIEQEELESGNK